MSFPTFFPLPLTLPLRVSSDTVISIVHFPFSISCFCFLFVGRKHYTLFLSLSPRFFSAVFPACLSEMSTAALFSLLLAFHAPLFLERVSDLPGLKESVQHEQDRSGDQKRKKKESQSRTGFCFLCVYIHLYILCVYINHPLLSCVERKNPV